MCWQRSIPSLFFPGKIRLKKFFRVLNANEKERFIKEAMSSVLSRKYNMCQVIEHKDKKLIYRRYASLVFCFSVDANENELIILELIHRYVTALDAYFGNVCELDLIFNFQSAYQILSQIVICGQQAETSVKEISKIIRKIDEVEAESLLGINKSFAGQIQAMVSQ